MLTLTVAEIKDLAECAGLVLKEDCLPDADELETEITIIPCPESGVLDDDGRPTHFAHVAYFAEYPDEGSYPLGNEIQPSSETIGRMVLANLKEAVKHTHGAGNKLPSFSFSSSSNCCNLNREEAFDAGKNAALNALETSPHPLAAMDELCNSEAETAYAMGWNSIWASSANKMRSSAAQSNKTYTVHFQKYPYPGASYGIKQLIARLSGTTDTVRLLGDPTGFEADIQAIKDAGINIQDDSEVAHHDNHTEIDLADGIKQRVAEGHPIYVTGTPQQGVLDAVTRIAEQAATESGKPAKVIQFVELPRLQESAVTLNPVATFVEEPDACMEMLIRGAEVSYLAVGLYEQAKGKGLEAAKTNTVSIKTLVDAWYAEPLLVDLAEAVERAFLPK